MLEEYNKTDDFLISNAVLKQKHLRIKYFYAKSLIRELTNFTVRDIS
jgi:hypothetical protein